MSERANFAKLGLFVVVSVVMLLGGLTLLGAGAFKKKGFLCETYFAEGAGGLEVGSAVKHKGVTIGKVTRMGFVSSKYDFPLDRTREQQVMAGYILVEMEVDGWTGIPQTNWEQNFSKTVDRGLRTQQATAGLMGAAYVEVQLVDPDRNPAMKIEWQPKLPYVPSAPNTMGQLKHAAERIAQQLENANIDQVVHNVDKLIKNLDKQVTVLDLKDTQAQVTALTKELRGSNAKLAKVLGNPAIEAMLTDGAKIAAAGSPAAADLRRLLRRLDGMLAGYQDDVETTLTGLRQTAENVEQLTGDAKENPSRLLFGEPPPRTQAQPAGNRE